MDVDMRGRRDELCSMAKSETKIDNQIIGKG